MSPLKALKILKSSLPYYNCIFLALFGVVLSSLNILVVFNRINLLYQACKLLTILFKQSPLPPNKLELSVKDLPVVGLVKQPPLYIYLGIVQDQSKYSLEFECIKRESGCVYLVNVIYIFEQQVSRVKIANLLKGGSAASARRLIVSGLIF